MFTFYTMISLRLSFKSILMMSMAFFTTIVSNFTIMKSFSKMESYFDQLSSSFVFEVVKKSINKTVGRN